MTWGGFSQAEAHADMRAHNVSPISLLHDLAGAGNEKYLYRIVS